MNKPNSPVLFLIFNRPANTKQVFEAIRNAQPKQLFVAADGPRNADEEALCRETRKCIDVDWDCEVKILYRDKNLGCKKAVSEAITWFFENVDEGIILEDDCLPDVSFFPFCTELLKKYRDDNKAMSISGSNLSGIPWKCKTQSYHYAHGGIWGWASWKRAWQLYDISMKDWQSAETKNKIKKGMGTDNWYNSYYGMFESTFNGTLDTWDVQWFYTILVNEGLAINPCVNLVKNIGFGNGTHTNKADNFITTLGTESMQLPLKHPVVRVLDIDYLTACYKATHQPAKQNIIRKVLRSVKKTF